MDKQASYRTVNADDNPIDEHGKTKRDYEIEEARKNAPEFQPVKNQNQGDPQGNFNQAAAALDPRNQRANPRPPVPGVDKPQGGSSEEPNTSGQDQRSGPAVSTAQSEQPR